MCVVSLLIDNPIQRLGATGAGEVKDYTICKYDDKLQLLTNCCITGEETPFLSEYQLGHTCKAEGYLFHHFSNSIQL